MDSGTRARIAACPFLFGRCRIPGLAALVACGCETESVEDGRRMLPTPAGTRARAHDIRSRLESCPLQSRYRRASCWVSRQTAPRSSQVCGCRTWQRIANIAQRLDPTSVGSSPRYLAPTFAIRERTDIGDASAASLHGLQLFLAMCFRVNLPKQARCPVTASHSISRQSKLPASTDYKGQFDRIRSGGS